MRRQSAPAKAITAQPSASTAVYGIIRFDRIGAGEGETVVFEMVFGKRERNPKWV